MFTKEFSREYHVIYLLSTSETIDTYIEIKRNTTVKFNIHFPRFMDKIPFIKKIMRLEILRTLKNPTMEVLHLSSGMTMFFNVS